MRLSPGNSKSIPTPTFGPYESILAVKTLAFCNRKFSQCVRSTLHRRLLCHRSFCVAIPSFK